MPIGAQPQAYLGWWLWHPQPQSIQLTAGQLARSLGKAGGLNWGSYSNPQIDDLLTQLRGELDPANRQALSRQIQQLAGADLPNIYLAVVPIVSAYRSGALSGFTPHPDDTYLIDKNVAITS